MRAIWLLRDRPLTRDYLTESRHLPKYTQHGIDELAKYHCRCLRQEVILWGRDKNLPR
jgi:hypothetical protein